MNEGKLNSRLPNPHPAQYKTSRESFSDDRRISRLVAQQQPAASGEESPDTQEHRSG